MQKSITELLKDCTDAEAAVNTKVQEQPTPGLSTEELHAHYVDHMKCMKELYTKLYAANAAFREAYKAKYGSKSLTEFKHIADEMQSNSRAETQPLSKLLRHYITQLQALCQAVEHEDARGRTQMTNAELYEEAGAIVKMLEAVTDDAKQMVLAQYLIALQAKIREAGK